MKKLIPYILAYILVAAGATAYSHFARPYHSPSPPNSVTVITTLSHDELAAKLQQVGLPEAAHMATMTVKPAPLLSLVFNFVRYAVILGTFAVLAHFLQRAFRTDVSVHDHAA
jgi:hypothetical protein